MYNLKDLMANCVLGSLELLLAFSLCGCTSEVKQEFDATGKPLPPYVAESEFVVIAKEDASRTKHTIYGPLLYSSKGGSYAWQLNLDFNEYQKVRLGDHIKSSSNGTFIYLEDRWVNIKDVLVR